MEKNPIISISCAWQRYNLNLVLWEGFISPRFDGKVYLYLVQFEGLSLNGLIGRFISTWFDWKNYHNLVLLEGLSLPGLIRRFFYTWYGGNVFFFFPLFNGKFWWEVYNLSSHGFMGMFYFHMVWWEGFISTWLE